MYYEKLIYVWNMMCFKKKMVIEIAQKRKKKLNKLKLIKTIIKGDIKVFTGMVKRKSFLSNNTWKNAYGQLNIKENKPSQRNYWSSSGLLSWFHLQQLYHNILSKERFAIRILVKLSLRELWASKLSSL